MKPLKQFLEDRKREADEMTSESIGKMQKEQSSVSDVASIESGVVSPGASEVAVDSHSRPSTKAYNKSEYTTEHKDMAVKIAQLMKACKKAADDGMDVLDDYDHAVEENAPQEKLSSLLEELRGHETECRRLNQEFEDELKKHEALGAPEDFMKPLKQFLEDRKYEEGEMTSEISKTEASRLKTATDTPVNTLTVEEYSSSNQGAVKKLNKMKKECQDVADDGMDRLDDLDQAVEENASRELQDKLFKELVQLEDDLKRLNHSILLEMKIHLSNGAPPDFIHTVKEFLLDREHERKEIVEAIKEIRRDWGVEDNRSTDDVSIENDLASEVSETDSYDRSTRHTTASARSRSSTANKPSSAADKPTSAQRTYMDSRGRPTTEGGGALAAYPIREKGDSQPSTPTDGGWASASERARSDQSRPSTLGTDSRPNTHGSGNIPIIVDADAAVEGEGEKISWDVKGRARDEGGLGDTSPRDNIRAY